MEAVGQQVVAQRHQHAQQDQQRRHLRVGEQHAEHADPDRTEAYLPFALDPVGDQGAEQRPDRIGDRDDE